MSKPYWSALHSHFFMPDSCRVSGQGATSAWEQWLQCGTIKLHYHTSSQNHHFGALDLACGTEFGGAWHGACILSSHEIHFPESSSRERYFWIQSIDIDMLSLSKHTHTHTNDLSLDHAQKGNCVSTTVHFSQLCEDLSPCKYYQGSWKSQNKSNILFFFLLERSLYRKSIFPLPKAKFISASGNFQTIYFFLFLTP